MAKKTEISTPPITEEVLPLNPLSIPTAVAVPFGDPDTNRYAVGINATKGGLKVFVDRYQRMLEGDYIEVFWNGSAVPAANTTVDEYNLNTRIGLNISESAITSGHITPYYKLTAVSSAEATSPNRDIWVKLDIPGGLNPEPGKQENGNLAAPIVPPDVAQSGVNTARAKNGVEITIPPYPNMAEYDRIEFWWGGQRKWILVQPGDVGRPVRFTVDEQTILAAGDGEIILHYQLIDAALNFSDGWSLSTKVKVTASNTQLAAPLVEGAVDGILELNALAGRDVNVQILALSNPFAAGDTIELLWAGRSADGGEVNYHASLSLQSVPQIPHFSVPYDKVAAIAQGAAIVSYILRKADGTEHASLRTEVNIRGQAFILAAPTVIQASAGLLAHDLGSATVRIAPYASMAQGNDITLVWTGRRADGQATYYHDSVTLTQNAVGHEVLFNVPGMEIAALTGGTLEIYYLVKATLTTEVPAQQSAHLQLQVTGSVSTLPAPTVLQANGERLDPTLPYADVQVPAYPGIRIGDDVQILWIGDLSGLYQDHQTVETPLQQASGLSLRVYGEYILTNLDHYITISYIVRRNGTQVSQSSSLRLRVGAAQAALPAPRVDQAQGNILITPDVPSSGASVRIIAAARLIAGDSGTVHWRGQTGTGTIDVPFTVYQTDQDVVVTVPHAVVAANNGFTVNVSYTVNRGGSSLTSPSASYEVRASSRTNRLIVMGARSAGQRDVSVKAHTSYIGLSSLTALDTYTHKPVEALWRYMSQTDGEAELGSRFVDTRPNEVLHVQALGERIQIRSRNIVGNGALEDGAVTAIRDNGSLVAWGAQNDGGAIPSAGGISNLTDIVAIWQSSYAFAALRQIGQVVAWGDADKGGKIPANGGIGSLLDIVNVAGNTGAFAAIRREGQVVAWGDPAFGGLIPASSGISNMTDIVEIAPGPQAFAAIRRSGHVVAWGNADAGGHIPASSGISNYTDIVEIISNWEAFAARRENGQVVAWGSGSGIIPAASGISTMMDIVSIAQTQFAFAAQKKTGEVVAWGNANYGGSIPAHISGMRNVVEVVGNQHAFAVRTVTGQVDAWGDPLAGGSFPEGSIIPGLNDIVEIHRNTRAFAVKRSTGQVMVWGDPKTGGSFPSGSTIPDLTDIIQVIPNPFAFAALRSNGTVVAWGDKNYGGAIPSNIAAQLKDVRAIYSTHMAFVALTADNRVFAWGAAFAGGNNAAIPPSLQGNISYEVE